MNIVRSAPFSCSISVFLQPELTHRGAADTHLLDMALELLEQHGELLTARLNDSKILLEDDSGIDDAADLKEWFDEHMGEKIAFGRYPPFVIDDGDELITGYAPDENGNVIPGIY